MATPNMNTSNRINTRSGTPDHDSYWRAHFRDQPYYRSSHEWEDYEPAYRYGSDSYNTRGSRDWNAAESDLEAGWERAKGRSRLAWSDAKHAVRDGWHRLERMIPGDADRDGR